MLGVGIDKEQQKTLIDEAKGIVLQQKIKKKINNRIIIVVVDLLIIVGINLVFKLFYQTNPNYHRVYEGIKMFIFKVIPVLSAIIGFLSMMSPGNNNVGQSRIISVCP